MNGNERSVQKMNGNARNVLNGNERDAQPWLTVPILRVINFILIYRCEERGEAGREKEAGFLSFVFLKLN